MATKTVTINGVVATPARVTLSKSAGDEVKWESTDDYGYTIDFGHATPFQGGATFTLPNGGSAPSGALKGVVAAGERYAYHIQKTGGGGADPIVDIEA